MENLSIIEELIYNLVDKDTAIEFSDLAIKIKTEIEEQIKSSKLIEQFTNVLWEEFLIKRDVELKKVFIYAFKLASEINSNKHD